MFNAFGANIENATGSNFADQIFGNDSYECENREGNIAAYRTDFTLVSATCLLGHQERGGLLRPPLLFSFPLLGFPTESFKSLKTFGISNLEYSKTTDIKLINCIMLTSRKREGENEETVYQKLDNIFKASRYSEKIGISLDELKNSEITEKDCVGVDYKSISELENKPSSSTDGW